MPTYLLLDDKTWRLPATADQRRVHEALRKSMADGEPVVIDVELGDDPRGQVALTVQRQQEHVAERQRQHAEAIANREAVEGLGWRARRQRLPGAEERGRMFGERLREQTAKLNELAPPGSEVRREHEIAGQLLAEREEKMLLAARLSPPAYVVKELGERPADSEKAKAWDRGVRDIESYRNERGVKDKDSALGRRPADSLGRTFHDHAQDRLREAQRRLDRIRQSERSMQRSREMSRGLDLGIGR